MKKYLLTLLGSALYAAAAYHTLVFRSGTELEAVLPAARTIQKAVENNTTIDTLRQEKDLAILARPSGRFYIAVVEPLRDTETIRTMRAFVKRYYPDAYLYFHPEAYTTGTAADETDGVKKSKPDLPPPVEPPAPDPVPGTLQKHRGVITLGDLEKNRTVQPETPALSAPVAPPPPPKSVSDIDPPIPIDPLPAPISEPAENPFSVMLLLSLLIIPITALAGWFFYFREKAKKKKNQEPPQQCDDVEKIVHGLAEQIARPVQDILDTSEKILPADRLTPEQTEMLHMIQSSKKQMLNLAVDLIEFMNIKADKIRLRYEMFHLDNVLDEVAGTLARRHKGRGIDMVFDFDRRLPPRLLGDPYYFGKVLHNLLSASLKQMDEGGEVRLSIRLLSSDPKRKTLRFSISDPGKNYISETLSSVFEPFSPYSPPSDSGLELFIAKFLALKMGGEIEAHEKAKFGRFDLTIPFELPDLERRYYPLPARAYIDRKILIAKPALPSAKAIGKMFLYFKNRVELLEKLDHLDVETFNGYDVVLIDKKAFTPYVARFLAENENRLIPKIVAVDNLFDDEDTNEIPLESVDAKIVTPLTRQRIYDLLIDLFKNDITPEREVGRTQTQPADTGSEHPEVPEKEGVTREDFGLFARCRILYAEDNIINQKVLLKLLETYGPEIVIAEDGQEALKKLDEEGPFDLILMDINMPVMDGYEATRRIRAQKAYADLPIVSLTGLGLPEEINKMYDIGMNTHLLKPLKPGQLYTVFERFLPCDFSGNGEAEQKRKLRLPEATPWLDTQTGLSMAGGQEALYLEVLSEFSHIYTPSFNKILQTDNTEKLKQIAVDIKGVASNIGARRLAESAAKLLEDLDRGAGARSAKKALKNDLAETLKAIHAILEEEEG